MNHLNEIEWLFSTANVNRKKIKMKRNAKRKGEMCLCLFPSGEVPNYLWVKYGWPLLNILENFDLFTIDVSKDVSITFDLTDL